MRRPSRALADSAVYVIELYRNMISPLRPPSCRFTPTCSEYAVDALRGHGFVRGTWLAMARLAKCGPWHRGGWDPIPEPRHRHDTHGNDTHGNDTYGNDTHGNEPPADDAATLRSDSLV